MTRMTWMTKSASPAEGRAREDPFALILPGDSHVLADLRPPSRKSGNGPNG
jgi:hypothetical protein